MLYFYLMKHISILKNLESRGSSHGPSRIIRYLYEHERYMQFMSSAFELWKQLEKEENVSLFTKCGILNVSEKERETIFTSILEKNGLDFDTYSNTEMIKKLPVTFK